MGTGVNGNAAMIKAATDKERGPDFKVYHFINRPTKYDKSVYVYSSGNYQRWKNLFHFKHILLSQIMRFPNIKDIIGKYHKNGPFLLFLL